MAHADYDYRGNACHLKFPLPGEPSAGGGAADGAAERQCRRRIENVRNCDVFVDDFNFLLYADVQLFKFQSRRQFDMKDMKNITLKFSAQERSYEVLLPCLQQNEEELKLQAQHTEKGQLEEKKASSSCRDQSALDLWKLKRITEQCQLQLDECAASVKLEADYGYGFASKFHGKIRLGDSDENAISRMPEPNVTSPLQRSIDREIDDLKNFSRDQYKLNFVELQVPEGHDNPMIYSTNYDDAKLTRDEECVLHNLTRKPAHFHMAQYAPDQTEIDCGLIDILLAICYDIRSTSNEPTCESAWTRATLSATLSYFQPFDNMKDVVVSFLRRSLIYPLYRNYNFGRMCVQDAIDALQKHPAWLLKQLLVTHELFLSSECNREVLNRYYIEDYIRYVQSNDDDAYCSPAHLQMLARNLKNVLLDVYKKHLRLELGAIETELLKELITDIHSGTSASEEDESEDYDDDDEDDDGTESGEDDGIDDDDDDDDETTSDTTSASETEENSVIEQRLDKLKM